MIIKLITLMLLLVMFSCAEKENKNLNSEPKEGNEKVTLVDQTKRNKEEAIYKTVLEWQESQNSGDFERYSSFYGTQFEGIKRVRKNTYKFNRKDWLNDRRRMFKKKMKVDLAAIMIDLNVMKSIHKVYFKQTWASGTYKDYGPKVLHMVESDGRYSIVFEEMLDSKEVLIANETSNVFDREDFFIRSGNLIFSDHIFNKGELIDSNVFCLNMETQYDACYSQEIFSTIVDSNSYDLFRTKIIIGDIYSNEVWKSEMTLPVFVSDEIYTELPGLYEESDIFDVSFSFFGVTDKKAILCELEEISFGKGQWALISNTLPKVFNKEYAENINEFLNKYDNESEVNAVHFYDANLDYFVSYNVNEECGDQVKDNVKLWYQDNDSLVFMSELPDLPAMILDLDLDGDLDMIYERQFDYDPYNQIKVQFPYFQKIDGDTVFIGCGC